MYEDGSKYGLYEPILNGSDAAQQQNRYKNYPINNGEDDKSFCQICSNKKYQMYTVSQRCDPSHRFCMTCLSQKLQDSISNNQDMYCPVDCCPFMLSENSQFFNKINNKLHNKYVAWKSSDKYMARNQSIRQSRRQSFANNNYFGNYGHLHQPNLKPGQQKENDVNQIKDIYQNQVRIKQKNRRGRSKDQKPKKERKQKRAIQHQEQRMLPAAPIRAAQPPPPIPFNIPVVPPAQVVIAPPPAPVIIGARQQLQPVPYTCCRRVVKFAYIAFGLPALFVMMALLMVMLVVFYTIVVASFLAPIACTVFAAYYAMLAATQNNSDIQNQSIVYLVLLLIGAIIGAGLARFFAKYTKYIYNLVIKNSWIWWISKVIAIWAYPNPAPVVFLEPKRIQQQQNNTQILL